MIIIMRHHKGIDSFLLGNGVISWTVYCHAQDTGIHLIPDIPLQEWPTPHDGESCYEVLVSLGQESLDSLSRSIRLGTVVSVHGPPTLRCRYQSD